MAGKAVAGFDGAIDDHEFAPARVGALRHRIVAHCSQTTRDLEVLDPVSHPQYEHAVGAQRHSRSTFMTRSCYALSPPALSRAAGT